MIIGNDTVIFLKRAIVNAPNRALLRYHLGVVYYGLNQPDFARKELERAVADGANYP